jgi:hypothetical protein
MRYGSVIENPRLVLVVSNVEYVPMERQNVGILKLSKRLMFSRIITKYMRELRQFLTHVITAKRKLKELYYTTRDADFKADMKALVASTIGVQKTLEDLVNLTQKSRIARKLLEDRKVSLTLQKWSAGFPKRVSTFVKRKRKMEPEHLGHYYEALSDYIRTIHEELTSWILDIETLRDIPKPPKRES